MSPEEEQLVMQEVEDALNKKHKPAQKRVKKVARAEKKRTEKRARSGNNPWIQFYMTWRKEHPDVVASTTDVKELVRLARKDYTPVNRGYLCESCGHDNQPPLKKAHR